MEDVALVLRGHSPHEHLRMQKTHYSKYALVNVVMNLHSEVYKYDDITQVRMYEYLNGYKHF